MFFRRSKTYLWEYKLREKLPDKAKGCPRRERPWFFLLKNPKIFHFSKKRRVARVLVLSTSTSTSMP